MSVKQLSFFDPIRIPLTKGQVALVDPIDADLAAVKWCAWRTRPNCTYYATRHLPSSNSKHERLHRVVLERKLGRSLTSLEQVDHINGNGLDNRRSNLRLATVAQNGWNSKTRKSNSSGYRGVVWAKREGKWAAQISVNCHYKHLGYYDDSVEAARAFNRAAIEYHGEFAVPNELD